MSQPGGRGAGGTAKETGAGYLLRFGQVWTSTVNVKKLTLLPKLFSTIFKMFHVISYATKFYYYLVLALCPRPCYTLECKACKSSPQSLHCMSTLSNSHRFILHTQRICISAEERRLWLVNSLFFPQCNSTTDNLYRIIAFGMLVAANYVLSVPNKQWWPILYEWENMFWSSKLMQSHLLQGVIYYMLTAICDNLI